MNTHKDKDKLKELSQALKNNLKRRKKNKNIKNKLIKVTIFLIFISFLPSCSKKLKQSGYLVSNTKMELIKVNKTSKQKLINLLGNPTTRSNFEPKTYYYMWRQYKQRAFFTSKLKEQKILSIEFNSKDIINEMNIHNKDAAKILNYDSEKINFEGNKIGILEQLLGNIGKFSSNVQKSAAK